MHVNSTLNRCGFSHAAARTYSGYCEAHVADTFPSRLRCISITRWHPNIHNSDAALGYLDHFHRALVPASSHNFPAALGLSLGRPVGTGAFRYIATKGDRLTDAAAKLAIQATYGTIAAKRIVSHEYTRMPHAKPRSLVLSPRSA